MPLPTFRRPTAVDAERRANEIRTRTTNAAIAAASARLGALRGGARAASHLRARPTLTVGDAVPPHDAPYWFFRTAELSDAERIAFGLPAGARGGDAELTMLQWAILEIEGGRTEPAAPPSQQVAGREVILSVVAAIAWPLLATTFGWWLVVPGVVVLLYALGTGTLASEVAAAGVIAGLVHRGAMGPEHWVGAAALATFLAMIPIAYWRWTRVLAQRATRATQATRDAAAAARTARTDRLAELRAIRLGVHPEIPTFEWRFEYPVDALEEVDPVFGRALRREVVQAWAQAWLQDRLDDWFAVTPAWRGAAPEAVAAERHRAAEELRAFFAVPDSAPRSRTTVHDWVHRLPLAVAPSTRPVAAPPQAVGDPDAEPQPPASPDANAAISRFSALG